MGPKRAFSNHLRGFEIDFFSKMRIPKGGGIGGEYVADVDAQTTTGEDRFLALLFSRKVCYR